MQGPLLIPLLKKKKIKKCFGFIENKPGSGGYLNTSMEEGQMDWCPLG